MNCIQGREIRKNNRHECKESNWIDPDAENKEWKNERSASRRDDDDDDDDVERRRIRQQKCCHFHVSCYKENYSNYILRFPDCKDVLKWIRGSSSSARSSAIKENNIIAPRRLWWERRLTILSRPAPASFRSITKWHDKMAWFNDPSFFSSLPFQVRRKALSHSLQEWMITAVVFSTWFQC